MILLPWLLCTFTGILLQGVIPLSQITAVRVAHSADGIKWPSLVTSSGETDESAAETETSGDGLDLRVVLVLPQLSYAVVFEAETAFAELLFALGRFAGLVREHVLSMHATLQRGRVLIMHATLPMAC